MRKLDQVVIHCSATRPSQDIGRAEINEWHKARGWAGIGYHYVIRRNGLVENGRPVAQAGAHVEGHNATTIGVVLVGGLDEQGKPAPLYDARQLAALQGLLVRLKGEFPQAFEKDTQGHRDFPGVAKACPSFDVRRWIATGEIRP